MAFRTFAQVDNDNNVDQVILIEIESTDPESVGIAKCQDIYGNDKNFVESFKQADGTSATRYNAAERGMVWDPDNNCFKKTSGPYPSWTLDTTDYRWHPPVAEPAYPEGEECMDYLWDEANTRWLKDPTLTDGIENYTQYWDPNTSTWKDI